MSIWSEIARHISKTTGNSFSITAKHVMGGGCINEAYRIEDQGRAFFVKLNDAASLPMFEAEAEGLKELASAQAIRVPLPVCWGSGGARSYLVMEYMEFGRGGDGSLFGRQLADLHRVVSPRFGWSRDNTIGSTPQINTPGEDWVEFWREHRFGFQLRLAKRNGHGGALQSNGARLLEVFPALFRDYTPQASLLHGDLWAGNQATDAAGSPLIFDPAVYYGDREADLAMTELFGGFDDRFYEEYRASFPLDAGYRIRKTFYNLYHILNHLNLFGGAYGRQAERMMASVLSELGV
ncbi:MAG: fructosamine kinase family protein [Gammaproteobacteria bacterium]|nr:fructosamine kinase family protein [Gammaproteobacteria bacterium]